jgi:diguanylate cyclase (GGDEF)-like protein
MTVSLGVATTENGASPVHALIAMADEALYRAKQAGRNRVMLQIEHTSTLHAPYPPALS